MKRTRNITVCVSESTYHQARVWAALRRTSISAAVQFLLEHLPELSRALRLLLEEDPNLGSPSKSPAQASPPPPTLDSIISQL